MIRIRRKLFTMAVFLIRSLSSKAFHIRSFFDLGRNIFSSAPPCRPRLSFADKSRNYFNGKTQILNPFVQQLSHRDADVVDGADATIREDTLTWLKGAIIGLNLCPFADKPYRQNAVHLAIVHGTDDDTILSAIYDEMLTRTTESGTTLVICPEYHPDDFEAYLDLLALVENGIIQGDAQFEGVVQVAPFHPLFQFEGSGADSVDNWTNRSPYPIFHILREEEVTKAVDQIDGDAGKVWRRNVSLLQAIARDMGSDSLPGIMRGKVDKPKKAILRELLRKFRIEFSSKQE